MIRGHFYHAFITGTLLMCALFSSLDSQESPLDRYVATQDRSFDYTLINTVERENLTLYTLSFISQKWRTEEEVDRPCWKHWLVIAKPKKTVFSTGLLFIGGGTNEEEAPKEPRALVSSLAQELGMVCAELFMVPNQPLTFKEEGFPRKEDAIIAYSWHRYFKTEDPTWIARLPMTKSAVKAMDAISAFCRGIDPKLDIQKFVVTGRSKRGWTTWTTAAVDRRVVAIIPTVIDMLNIEPSMLHHYQAYGYWAPALDDYKKMQIPKHIKDRLWKQLLGIVDPYVYRDRYVMPKLIVNACGDQFFLPDSSRFYFKDLQGEKYLRYIPNVDHSLVGADEGQTILSYLYRILHDKPRPDFRWEMQKDGSLLVKTRTTPDIVNLWQAYNENTRDFRSMTLGKSWKSVPLKEESQGAYAVRVAPPERGWIAWFVELTFSDEGKMPLKLTTEVYVTPDTLPFSRPSD